MIWLTLYTQTIYVCKAYSRFKTQSIFKGDGVHRPSGTSETASRSFRTQVPEESPWWACGAPSLRGADSYEMNMLILKV